MKNSLLNIKDLQVYFNENGNKVIYDDFEVFPGDIIRISGENGSGKSTLLKVLSMGRGNNLNKVHDGYPDIIINNQSKIYVDFGKREYRNDILGDFTGADFYKLNTAYAKQETEHTMFESAYKVLVKNTIGAGSILRHSRLNPIAYLKKRIKLFTSARRYINKYLKDHTGISYFKFRLRNFQQLSGGQKRLIYLFSLFLKAEVLNCKLMLLDEPMNNLDSKAKMIVNNQLQDLREKNPGLAVIMVSHCNVIFNVNKSLIFEKNHAKLVVEPEEVFYCLNDKDIIQNSRYIYARNDER